MGHRPTSVTSPFALPDRLAAKSVPSLIGADEVHLAGIATSLADQVGELSEQLDQARRLVAREGTAAVERDQEVHRLTARLRTLRRFGLDLCLGRMVAEDGTATYVGRLGLTSGTGERLLVDWRSPAAEPFFGATHGHPMGLASRRRFRWTRGLITDYWDEVFSPTGLGSTASLDDRSAFVASLGASRSDRMRDVLGTLQADQDAIIRAGAAGALVVDGGPGTGKTVVALHRAAYLLHADPRLRPGRGGVLVVGPHEPYLAYVDDVLPSLGEDGVRTCTVRDLVPEGRDASPEHDPEVARLKAAVELVRAIEPAVALYEEPPTEPLDVETPWTTVRLRATDWAEAFGAADPGTPHNEARDQVWDALVEILADLHVTGGFDEDGVEDERPPIEPLRRALERNAALVDAFDRAWTVVEPADLVADLWSVPAYLRHCAPGLTADEVNLLGRDDPYAWTTSDLPLLDAARRRLGDPDSSRRRRERERTLAAERAQMNLVVDELIASDDSELLLMRTLRGDDMQVSLEDEAAVDAVDPDTLVGPFAHVVVDEAQELTDAEWQMVLARCPSRSLTIVGDRAQARHGFAESWQERLARVGVDRARVASLTINYRTPSEVMEEAEPLIRAAVPDANVPTSVRASGVPVEHRPVSDLAAVLRDWLASGDEGVACVIGSAAPALPVTSERVRSLTPALAKGLEFDLVVLIDPERFGTGTEGAVDRYVAMTRATQRLVVLTSSAG
ncbi:RNA polymerase recycling motor ATPase HelR [Aeromicrobium sp. Sec7.5]|uniref:RNA polymerase recycling motor ATPase HelR n=1 Tax=Aeromicrobium sp. Sec7.5 TaxID=3121276 RepID=UPI002FE4A11E